MGLALQGQTLRLCQLWAWQRFLFSSSVGYEQDKRGGYPGGHTVPNPRRAMGLWICCYWTGRWSQFLSCGCCDRLKSEAGQEGEAETSPICNTSNSTRSDWPKHCIESPEYLVLRDSGGIYKPWAKSQSEPVAKPRSEAASWNSTSVQKTHLCQP